MKRLTVEIGVLPVIVILMVLMFLFSMLTACGMDTETIRYRLPPRDYGDYAAYVDDYMDYARLYGVAERTYIKQFTTITVADNLADEDDPEVAAVCWSQTNILKNRVTVVSVRIVISREFNADYKNTILMRWTMFHELGHCLHGLPHVDNPKEIMNPMLPNINSLYADYYKLPNAIERMFAKIRDDAL